MAYILVILGITSIPWGAISVTPPIDTHEISIQNVIQLTNESRTEHGLEPLKMNAQLKGIAEYKATNMSVFQLFDHIDSRGKYTYEDAPYAGYPYTFYGENLATEFTDVELMQKSWMESPTHRDNILNPNYQDIGVGIEKGTLHGREVLYVAVEFGRQ